MKSGFYVSSVKGIKGEANLAKNKSVFREHAADKVVTSVAEIFSVE